MIVIQTLHSIKCVHIEGRLDTLTSGDFDVVIMPLLQTEKALIVDLSKCSYDPGDYH